MSTTILEGDALRVLHLVTDDDRRGAQIFAADLHAALERRGHDSRIRALARGTAGGLDIPRLSGRTSIGRLRQLRRDLREVDVAIAHGSRTVATCALMAPVAGVPFVARRVSDGCTPATGRFRQIQAGLAFRRADRVVVGSAAAGDELVDRLGIDRFLVVVIAPGVPNARFEAASSLLHGTRTGGELVVGYLGALTMERGVDLAIEAMEGVPGARLVVAGDGPERQRLEALARNHAPGRVDFVGLVGDPLSFYQSTDVLVMPSRGGDGMPAVIIEAGLAGLPTVATPVGTIPDIVDDGRTGILVAVDDVDGLRAALGQLSNQVARRWQLSATARLDYASRFSIDTVARHYERCLRRVVEHRQPLATPDGGGTAAVGPGGWGAGIGVRRQRPRRSTVTGNSGSMEAASTGDGGSVVTNDSMPPGPVTAGLGNRSPIPGPSKSGGGSGLV
jgi:glycosyltransferase involved in cell wall biosynthesis